MFVLFFTGLESRVGNISTWQRRLRLDSEGRRTAPRQWRYGGVSGHSGAGAVRSAQIHSLHSLFCRCFTTLFRRRCRRSRRPTTVTASGASFRREMRRRRRARRPVATADAMAASAVSTKRAVRPCERRALFLLLLLFGVRSIRAGQFRREVVDSTARHFGNSSAVESAAGPAAAAAAGHRGRFFGVGLSAWRPFVLVWSRWRSCCAFSAQRTR